MMMFKREGDGTWMFGQKKVIVEAGSHWAINPMTFAWGYICFGDNKRLGERMVPITQAMPDVTAVPDHGFAWQVQWSVNMKCLDGADAGVEVVFKSSTDGGTKAVAGLVETVRDRLNGGQHDGKFVPIATLEKDHYMHKERGRVWFPVFGLTGWMTLDGPAPAAPAPTTTPPPSDPQPRRRRVA
jgi:hypothetical protein